MANEICYDCRWSTDADEKFIQDFLRVENAVFKNGYSKELFMKKFVDNPYGPSVVEVVYIDGKPEAARALWRNDVLGRRAYQPGDTCVTEACRGKGIFTEMTKRSLAMVDVVDMIYNFPNQNSYHGYMKLGWELLHEYGFGLLLCTKSYLREHPQKIDSEYYSWWIAGRSNLYVMERDGERFLVSKMSKPFCYKVIACMDGDVQPDLPRMGIGVCFYRTQHKSWYNKRIGLPLRVVGRNAGNTAVPVWKIDAI